MHLGFKGVWTDRQFDRKFADIDRDTIPMDSRVLWWYAWDTWDYSSGGGGSFPNKKYRCIGPSHMGGGDDTKSYNKDPNVINVLMPRAHLNTENFAFWDGHVATIPDLGSADAYQRPSINGGIIRFSGGNDE
jgi:prepilin-type processing-associated H-X9-DG protein